MMDFGLINDDGYVVNLCGSNNSGRTGFSQLVLTFLALAGLPRVLNNDLLPQINTFSRKLTYVFNLYQ